MKLLRSMMVAAVGLLSVAPLCASERVTLRNGFELYCLRREVSSPGRVRLYTSQENYMEVAEEAIASVVTTPDPLPVETQPVQPTPHQADTATTRPTSMTNLMQTAGQQHNIDVDLLAAVIRAESGGNRRAVSHVGAQGLMQLMPDTARQLGVKDAFAADQNINGGTTYLDQLLTRYHDDISLALAAYNAGPGAVDRYHGIPPFRETRAYVARIIHEFNRRKLAQQQAEYPQLPSTQRASR